MSKNSFRSFLFGARTACYQRHTRATQNGKLALGSLPMPMMYSNAYDDVIHLEHNSKQHCKCTFALLPNSRLSKQQAQIRADRTALIGAARPPKRASVDPPTCCPQPPPPTSPHPKMGQSFPCADRLLSVQGRLPVGCQADATQQPRVRACLLCQRKVGLHCPCVSPLPALYQSLLGGTVGCHVTRYILVHVVMRSGEN